MKEFNYTTLSFGKEVKQNLSYMDFISSMDNESRIYWNKERRYDQPIIDYFKQNKEMYIKKNGDIDMFKLYDDILFEDVLIDVKSAVLKVDEFVRVLWVYLFKRIPTRESYEKMYNKCILCYRYYSYYKIKKMYVGRKFIDIFDTVFKIIEKDHNRLIADIAKELECPMPLIAKILLDDLREII